MKINILLPYKEKFDENKASSVSITVKNNLSYTKYIDDVRIYGQSVENPIFKNNFIGLRYSIFSLQSKNKFLAHEMLNLIKKDHDKKQIIEVHNRPYIINQISKQNKFPTSLFLHNDPQTMKGSKSIKDRENILRKCVAVFCVSEFIKNKFIEGISRNVHKVHVLYNGVENKLKKFPKKEKEILFVGRLVPEKGVDLYVNVIKSIISNYPDWNFGLIGSSRLGDNENNNSFAKKVLDQFNSVGSQAKFYGYKEKNFVDEKMKSASIIIIPSLWEEPFGLVAAEAMSNGIAIIASRSGGIPEIVGKNAILIDQIDYAKLKSALVELIENKRKRILFQKKSWDNFKHSSEKSSKKLDKYRQIIFKMCW